MSYTAYYFKLEPYNKDYAEVLVALLDDIGFEGIQEEGKTLTGYIPSDKLSVDALTDIRSALEDMGSNLSWTYEEIREQNWNKLWESNFEPVFIDTRCVIRAPFHNEFPEILYRITIEPKMSFGTGHHSTTRMMIEKILETNIQQKKILDMGCGTGVLSILASMCGAENITAIDIDKWAYDNTLENIQINNRLNIQAIMGGKESIPDKQYDIIFANINRNILLDQMSGYSRHLFSGGALFISGILCEDIAIINENAIMEGFIPEADKILGNWAMLSFRRK
jgi:ribosomal protein L11 methyltransferase